MNNQWIYYQEKLLRIEVNHFSNLYSSDSNIGGDFILGGFPQIKHDKLVELQSDYTWEEVYATLKEMGSLKASGPDSFEVASRLCSFRSLGKS